MFVDSMQGQRNTDLLHGGNLASVQEQFPKAPLPWLDLSTGINPWPFPYSRLSSDVFEKLPTAALQQRALTAASTAFGCGADHIALTAGSQAAIQLLPSLHPSKRVAIVAPTYSEHALCWRRAGAEITEISFLPDRADAFDTVVVVNPNNPDGRIHSRRDLKQLASDLSKRGGHLVVDEAFADIDNTTSLVGDDLPTNVALLRSFGKFFGLAGIRLGAIIGSPTLIAVATTQMGPWAVSGPALEIGAQAYESTSWQVSMRAKLTEAANALDAALTATGIEVSGGTTLFRWVKFKDAHTTWQVLASKGIYVRRFAWSTTHLRFGIPVNDSERQRLIEALRAA